MSSTEEIKLPDGGLKLSRRDRQQVATSAASTGQQRAARVITMAWGDSYVADLLSLTIPALLAPGNLPAFAQDFDCEFVIVTETRLFDMIAYSPVIFQLLRYCDLRLVPIDDLLSPWYGITLTYALVRGFADLGADMCETHLVFLNADFIVADGSYAKLAEAIRRGERLVVAPSYCMVQEDTIDEVRTHYDWTNHSLAINHREMAAMIIAHRHNTVRAKTVNQQLFHMRQHEQFYWYVDEQTLLARQMPISVVYMRPERVVTEMPTFWDYGVVSECCPTTIPCVLSDSDDFLMAELRGEDTFRDFFHLGRPTVEEIAAELSSFTTKDHRDYGHHTLVLHSADLPLDVDREIAALGTFVDAVYARLSPPVSYYNHHSWTPWFPSFLNQRRKRAEHNQLKATLLCQDAQAFIRHERIGELQVEIQALVKAERVDEEKSVAPAETRLALIEAGHLTRYRMLEREISFLLEQSTDDIQFIRARLAVLRNEIARFVLDKKKKIQDLTGADAILQNRSAVLRSEAEHLGWHCVLEQELSCLQTADDIRVIRERLLAMRNELGRFVVDKQQHIHNLTGENAIVGNQLAALRDELTQLILDEQQQIENLNGEQLSPLGSQAGIGTEAAPKKVFAPLGSLGRGLYHAIFGQLPDGTKWHPYYTVLRPALNAIATANNVSDVLLISSGGPLGALLIKGLDGQKITVTPAMVMSEIPNSAVGAQRKFQLCVCDFSFSDLLIGRHLIEKMRPFMSEHGKIIVFYRNDPGQLLGEWTYNFTRGLFPLFGKSRIHFAGSRLGTLAMRLFDKALRRRPRWQLPVVAVMLSAAAPLARLAARMEGKRNSQQLPAYCASMTLEIDLP